ncbi:hypothetical protein HNP46_006824 [Pseudomonas nitritireducens]|uniref:Uncharacterized protein n=1 Tax=Pseudomonas nitroreducens TaxID=46680 RepID=A0A7W7P5P1_PSENT|nr:hypothetical protein [Pseudomonas nitritireducens]MBB4867905.1 hypothetical protein [Pseudomonas nitritireducens]
MIQHLPPTPLSLRPDEEHESRMPAPERPKDCSTSSSFGLAASPGGLFFARRKVLEQSFQTTFRIITPTTSRLFSFELSATSPELRRATSAGSGNRFAGRKFTRKTVHPLRLFYPDESLAQSK